MASASPVPAARGRRLNPEARRQHILDAARALFSERPYTSVTTADVARAAGVARSLVHHYFGGIGEVFVAVVAQGGAALSDVRTAGPETPFDERLARNIAASLDVIAENRETWLAVAGHGAALGDPRIRALVDAAVQRSIERTLAANPDVIQDTPVARYALRCFNAFSAEATRVWLTGEATRAATEALLVTASRDLLLHTIPALD
jgi:AcrR family transcriptional regulator